MQLKAIYMLPGETQRVQSDWTAECEERGTTVSASLWEVESGYVTMTSPTMTGNVASVLVSPSAVCSSGSVLLINTATLANGEILKSEREVISQWM